MKGSISPVTSEVCPGGVAGSMIGLEVWTLPEEDFTRLPGPVPTFLTLPSRPEKPRAMGLTHVLDKGVPLPWLEALMDAAGEYIDILKLGWGTSYVSRQVHAKADLCAVHNVRLCPGGTLFEIAAAQDRIDQYFRWLQSVGISAIEISNGVLGLSVAEKQAIIKRAANDFVVLSEVGSKDPAAPVVPAAWVDEILSDLSAGAMWVVAEARESGTVGLYDHNGNPNEPLLDAIVRRCPIDRIIYEAPLRDQQSWLIQRLSPSVNLGNIPFDDVIATETLRRGLRADTAPALLRRPQDRADTET